MSDNPKRAASANKIRFHGTPAIVEAELAAVMASEGGARYGAFNYRATPVLASDYYNANRRHMTEFWELGENIDGPSGFAQITKAIASLVVLRDAQINGMMIDDRPPPVDRNHWERIQNIVGELNAKYPNPEPTVTTWGRRHTLQEGEIKIENVDASEVYEYHWMGMCRACGVEDGAEHRENCPRGRKFSAGQVRT